MSRRYLVSVSSLMPVTVAEAKAHMRVQHASDDNLIERLIETTVDGLSHELGRALRNETWDGRFDEFADPMELPRVPLLDVEFIEYVDSDGNTQTLSTAVYAISGLGEDQKGLVHLVSGQSWPALGRSWQAVTVRFTAGYEAGSPPAWSGPAAIKEAVLRLVAHRYENRESTLIAVSYMTFKDVEELLNPFQVYY